MVYFLDSLFYHMSKESVFFYWLITDQNQLKHYSDIIKALMRYN